MSLYNSLSLVRQQYPDFGQVYYMVDSDYRTAAQGWSQGDRTGPLDLYEARKAGPGGAQYVFRTGDYTTDAVALQTAIDTQVDFRGDALVFTPGNYSIATAQTIDVPDARWLGPPVSHPALARSTLTAAVAAAFAPSAAADRMEIGYLRMVPLTAGTMWNCGALTGLDVHDVFYNSDGIAANTATIYFVLATATEFASFRRSYIWNDAAQGPWIQATNIIKGLSISDFEIYQEAGSWATVLDFLGVGTFHAIVRNGYIGGALTAVTTLATIADKTSDIPMLFLSGIRSTSIGPAAGTLVTPTTDAGTAALTDCWRGVVIDTAQPTFTSGANITWESGVPYTG